MQTHERGCRKDTHTYGLNYHYYAQTALPPPVAPHQREEAYKRAATKGPSWNLVRGWSPPRFSADWDFQSRKGSKLLTGDCSKSQEECNLLIVNCPTFCWEPGSGAEDPLVDPHR